MSAVNRIVNLLKGVSPWHLLWVSIVASELFTLAVSVAVSRVFWGRVPREVVVVGFVDALIVDVLIVTVIIILVARVSRLKQKLLSRGESERRFRTLAHYDSLTNLPNRALFRKLLKKALNYAERYRLVMAVLFIDLDHFKRINDTLGHVAGDRLLRDVTVRILKTVRSFDYVAHTEEDEVGDVVSRLGGDEFILLLHNLTHPEDAGKVAHRILNDMAAPFNAGGHEIFVTASIGISLYPADGSDGDELIKNADVAMYHAKASGKNNCQYYSSSMNATALESLALENRLHRALEQEEFLLHYQPKMSVAGSRVNGMEALIRWKAAGEEMILPSQFISLAEETGIILPIGEWALRAACAQNVAWQRAGLEPVVVSVNLSNRQFDQNNLIKTVTGALNESGLDPRYLELEITESAVMKDPDEATGILRELKKLGVRLSIDDFGTGYSSLNYLKRLPLDAIKIDRSFVSNLTASANDAAIVEAVINLAHNLKLRAVAEGVETVQQLEYLRRLGCDDVQGFLLGRPLPAEEAGAFLAAAHAQAAGHQGLP